MAAFLRDPGPCRVVLLYGEDHGMIRDRAAALVRAVAGSLDDPFLVAELAREDIAALAAEAASLPLTGGRRVVRLREATDAATDAVAAVLKGAAPALVVLEAPGLATRSRLRTSARRRAGWRGDRLLSRGRPGAGRDDPRGAGARPASASMRTRWPG